MATPAAARGHRTRARLLEAAVQLIVEEGWGAVTTRKMAERAGVRPGVVHYHFDTVADLLAEAAIDATRREFSGVLDLMREAEDASAGLDALVAAVTAYSTDDPVTVLIIETMLAATRDERLRTELSGLLAEMRAPVAEWLRGQDGIEDPEVTAAVLVGALDGLVLHCLLDPRLRAAPLAGPLKRLAGLDAPAEHR